MKLVRDFERRLEQLVDGMAGRVFRGKLHPIELASRLVREADLSVADGPAGTTAANVYSLRLNPRDLDTEVPSGLVSELEVLVESTAADRGWRLDGPALVSLEPNDTVPAGTVECRVARSPGARSSWALLAAANGTEHLLRYNRCLVGRADTADIVISHPGVSRTHALVWREGGDAWVVDLGSANGTKVDGGPSDGPTMLTTGSVVTFGPVAVTFRLE